MKSSPQLEDGFTRLANELIEELLQARLSSRQWAVVMALARKTYGFNKKTDDIGLSQLADLTGLAKPHVSVAVRELEDRRIISRKQGKFGHIMGINKDHSQWVGVERRKAPRRIEEVVIAAISEVVTELVTVTESVTVTELDSGVTELVLCGVTDSVTTKDNPTKDIKQKKAPREEMNFKQWLAKCKSEGVMPVPTDAAIFDWANDINLPFDYVHYVWLEFKRKYLSPENSRKKYKMWDATFANAVRDNWYGIWYERDGEYLLTTRGKMLAAWVKSKNEKNGADDDE